jgi:hypothetical protein
LAFCQLALDEVKAIKNEYGSTVNDVTVSLAAGVGRRWLGEQGRAPRQAVGRAPAVSVRSEEQRGTCGNRVGTMNVPLFTSQSYCGQLDVGIVADREQIPEAWKLIGFLRESLDELRPTAARK